MLCWKCKKNIDLEKTHFKSYCEHCDAWLHCCLNCQHHSPGKPNKCFIPDSEIVKDRQKFNFCDDFVLKINDSEKYTSPSEAASKLFGEDNKIETKSTFNTLFKD